MREAAGQTIAPTRGIKLLGTTPTSVDECVECLLEAVGMRALRLGEGFEPIGDFIKPFSAGRLGHARIHVRVLVGFASNGGFKVIARTTNR